MLTGTWEGWTSEGHRCGTFYIHQIGDIVWWYGEMSPAEHPRPQWSQVAHGKVGGHDLILSWADVPKGMAPNHGIVLLRVVSDNLIEAVVRFPPGYAAAKWTRRSAGW